MLGANILIVDDEPLIGYSLKRELGDRGYQVDSVLSGEEAQDAVKQKKYDLALIDKNMPGINGIETCRCVKSSCPDMVVIFITGENRFPQEEAAAAGGSGFLFKPFAAGEVLAAVQKALG